MEIVHAHSNSFWLGDGLRTMETQISPSIDEVRSVRFSSVMPTILCVL